MCIISTHPAGNGTGETVRVGGDALNVSCGRMEIILGGLGNEGAGIFRLQYHRLLTHVWHRDNASDLTDRASCV